MKKIISIVIITLLLINLSGCGDKGSKVELNNADDPIVGMWNAFLVTLPDDIIEINDMYQKGISLELKSNGNYTIDWDGAKSNGKWSYKDDVIVISRKDGDFTGSLIDGVITLINVLDIDMNVAFEKEGGYAGKFRPKEKVIAGYYILDEATEEGETISGDDLKDMNMDYYVLMKEDGTLECMTDELDYGIWEKGVMTLYNPDFGNIDLNYTLEGEKLTIDWDGLILVYLRSTDTPPDNSLATIEELSELQQWWDGDWYGYRETHSETETYKDLEDGRWECFGLIEMNEDDTGEIYIWDSLEDFAKANITVSEDSGQGSMGAAISNNGNLWFGYEIGRAGWIIDPSIYGHDNYLVIDGRYEDESGGGFNYVIYLKPWGESWEEFSNDERPIFYDPWYLSAYKLATMWEAIDDRKAHIHSEIENVPEIGDYLEAYKNSQSIETPVAEKKDPSVPVSSKSIEAFYKLENGVKISAMLPEGSWCSKDSREKIWFYNVPIIKDAYSNSPVIIVEFHPELKHFDFYKADFENLETIKNRKIGGIDMSGRTYKNIGMEWIEYTGVIDDKNSVSIRISRIDVSSGEGSAVLDSIKFNQ